MAKQRVLVLTTTFPRWLNDSTPQFVYQLSNRLGAMHSLTVLAPHYPNASKQERMGMVDVRRFPYFKPESLQKLCYDGGIIPNLKKSFLAKIQLPLLLERELMAARKIVKHENISLLHAHWVLPQGLIGALLKRSFKIPLIITIHGSDLFPLKSNFFRRLQQFSFAHADAITVNSDATKKELLSRFPWLKSKVRLIPMGVDINHFRPRSIKKPTSLIGSKVILFVGRLSDQKGIQYVIDAMPKILKKEPQAKFIIIGEGPYKKELEQQIYKKNVGNAVQFLGALTQEEVAYHHNICDVFVLPALSNTTGTEALGLSLIEAMASGCPVIGTKVGGIPTIIENDKNGMIIEQKNSEQLADTIIGILKNKKKSQEMGKNATAFVRKHYSWDIVVKSFLKLYDEVSS